MKLTKQKLNEYESNLLKSRPDLLNKIITENFRCYVYEIIGLEYENCFVIQNLTLSEKSKPVYDTIPLRIVEKYMNDSKPDLLNNDVIVYNSNQIFGDSDISSENINCAYINGTVFFLCWF